MINYKTPNSRFSEEKIPGSEFHILSVYHGHTSISARGAFILGSFRFVSFRFRFICVRRDAVVLRITRICLLHFTQT